MLDNCVAFLADILSKKVVLFTHAAYTFTHGKMKIQRNLLEMLENKFFFNYSDC